MHYLAEEEREGREREWERRRRGGWGGGGGGVCTVVRGGGGVGFEGVGMTYKGSGIVRYY